MRKLTSWQWLIVTILTLQTISVVQAQHPPAPQAPHVPEELLVKFADGPASPQAGWAHAQVGAAVLRNFPFVGWQRVRLPRGLGIAAAIARYGRLPGVVAAEPNYVRHLVATPNDPRFGELYGLHNTGQSKGTPDADIDAPEAWDTWKGSDGDDRVVVAVIDTGVDYNHTDLKDNMWKNPGEIPNNFVDDDNNGRVDDIYGWDFIHNDSDPMDDHSHGSHCAGIIGARGNNGAGVVGVNWKVSIMALKIIDANGYGTSAGMIEAFEYVTAMKSKGVNIKVTSNSYGGDPYSEAEKEAIDACGNTGAGGIVHVFASGNGVNGIGQNNDSTNLYPASYTSDSIIAVAASDRNDNRASFSNYGATSVDLAAPGVNILSTVLGGAYGTKSGTSMACPYVAGAVALLASYDGSRPGAELKGAILDTVDKRPQWKGLVVSEGRLNVARALQSFSPGSLQFGATAYSVNEVNGNVTITVTRTGSSLGVAWVDYATSNGSAIVDADYLAAAGRLYFADSEITKSSTIPILDDNVAEPNETVNITLSNATGAPLVGPSTAVLTIMASDQVGGKGNKPKG